MYIPDDEQLIKSDLQNNSQFIMASTVRTRGFIQIIGIYPYYREHPDTATMCNNAQLAASEDHGKF